LPYPYSTIEVRGEIESDSKIGSLVGRVSDLVKDSSHISPAFPLERSCEGQAARPTLVAYLDHVRDCLVIGLAAPSASDATDPHADNLLMEVMCVVPVIRS
jgi:hypothetical protein